MNFALVDCNSFFVSCERLRHPELAKSPVIVLSNNDGCVVSRSDEAKALGIGMGVPYFKVKKFFTKQSGIAFSSDFAFYKQISRQVMAVLQQFSPDMEIYSIDEAFLSLNRYLGANENYAHSYLRLAEEIRERVLKDTGIPVSVGLAPNKTLAKLANELAKKKAIFAGTLSLLGLSPKEREAFLEMLPVEEVWGVGRRIFPRLRSLGIKTALDLAKADEQLIKQISSVRGMRTVLELRGQSCEDLATTARQSKSLLISRTFKQRITNLQELQAKLANYIFTGCSRLRGQSLQAQHLQLFFYTDPYHPKDKQDFAEVTLNLLEPSDFHGDFVEQAMKLVTERFKTDCAYKRAGVRFERLSKHKNRQISILDEIERQNRGKTWQQKKQLGNTIDQINQRFADSNARLILGKMLLKQERGLGEVASSFLGQELKQELRGGK